MDVNYITNIPYSIPHFGENGELIPGRILEKKAELPYPLSKEDGETERIREQFVMNLEQVQNFLYMMIGSKLRIHSDNNSIGSTINTAA